MLDRLTWLNKRFDLQGLLPYSCPKCHKDRLQITTVRRKETLASRSEQDFSDNSYGGPDKEFLVNGFASCTHCKELLTFIALNDDTQENRHYIDMAEERGMNHGEAVLLATYPYLKLFKVALTCPKNIRKVVESAFAVYFTSRDASANRIRVALELVCNHEGIATDFLSRNNKVRKYNLKERLDKLEEKYPKISLLGDAMRNLGNLGSHSSGASGDEVVDLFMLLEYLINSLYGEDNDEILKLVVKHS